MKIILLVIVIIFNSFHFRFYSQTLLNNNDIMITHNINDSIFKLLNKNLWNTGILYIGNDSIITQFNDNNVTIVNSVVFRDILFEIITNSLFMNSNDLLKKKSLDTIFKHAHKLYNDSNIIPIGVINVKFNVIKKSALDSGYLQIINTQLVEIDNDKNKIYETKEVYIAAPLIDFTIKENTHISLRSNFIFKNHSDTVNVIINELSNSKILNDISPDYKLNFDYNGNSHFNCLIKKNNTTITSTFICNIKLFLSNLEEEHLVVGGDSNDPWDLLGLATIRYGCGNTTKTIKKPFVFVEGFDPGMNYGEMNNFGRLNWEIFSNWNNPYGDTDHDGFPDYINLQKGKLLIDKLNADGFDIIYLEFKNSTRDIRENAKVLRTLLYYIDQNKTTKHKTILAGGSMGGLVAKIALNMMYEDFQKNEITKINVRDYITFDSPHFNANIPLGDQFFVKFFSEGLSPNSEASWAKNVLKSTASQQMLRIHYLDFITGRPIFYEFKNDSKVTKVPYFIRNRIAISNGSNKGLNGHQGYAWGTQMVDMVSSCSGILPGRGRGKTWAVPPNNFSVQIFNNIHYPYTDIFKGDKQECVFWGILEDLKVSVKNCMSIDNSPGGQRFTNKSLIHQGGSCYTPNHCFVPTTSALGLEYTTANNTDYFYDLLNTIFLNPTYNYLPNKNVAYIRPPNNNLMPFNILFAPDNNEQHVEITDENINFLINEISPSDLYLQNQTYPLGLYGIQSEDDIFEARSKIIAGKNITNKTDTGYFLLNPGSDVSFKSGDKIILKDGFRAKEGSVFKAFIEPLPCSSVNKTSLTYNNNFQNSNNQYTIYHTRKQNNYFIEKNQDIIKIFPNPTSSSIFIETINENLIKSVIVKDISGKTVLHKNINNKNIYTLNVNELSNGIYFIQINSAEGIFTKKIIILH